jgi:hypothetical protein
MSLKGIHTIYSLSERERYDMPSYSRLFLFEFLYLTLSSHLWRLNNGPIKLICDLNFYEFVKQNNLFWVWDEIDNTTLKSLPQDIDYKIFWTYPKMFAQFFQKERFAIVDADLYTTLDLKGFKEDIVYGHEEIDNIGTSYPLFYKDPSVNFLFSNLNPTLKYNAINTCLVVYNNLGVLEELKEITEKFIRISSNSLTHPDKEWVYTIFCEQKILGNIVKDKGFSSKQLAAYPYNCNDYSSPYYALDETGINHLWAGKKILHQNPEQRYNFTLNTLDFISNNYPQLYIKIEPYLNKFQV